MNVFYVGPTPRAKRYDLIRSKLTGNVTLKDVLSASRRADVVRVRQEVWYIMYHEWKYTTVRLGDIWSMDHSTIVHGIAAHRRRTNGQLSCNDNPISDSTRQRSSGI